MQLNKYKIIIKYTKIIIVIRGEKETQGTHNLKTTQICPVESRGGFSERITFSLRHLSQQNAHWKGSTD